MKPDINKYLPMLDGMDLSREQKIKLIHDLWHIMQSFVDRAFGVHPLQQCRGINYKSDLQDLDESINLNSIINAPAQSEGDTST